VVVSVVEVGVVGTSEGRTTRIKPLWGLTVPSSRDCLSFFLDSGDGDLVSSVGIWSWPRQRIRMEEYASLE